MGIIYNDENWQSLLDQGPRKLFGAPGYLPRLTRYGSLAAERFGLIPTTEVLTPVPQSDWKEVIAECHAKKIFAMYHRAASPLEQKPSQNRTNFCWAWSARAALENARLLEGQPAVKLAPVSLGWLVNWRNAGNWLDVTIKGMRERGICSAAFVPNQYDYSGRSFKAGWEQDALNYRLGEVSDTDRNEGVVSMISQSLAILKTGTSGYAAWKRLEHAMIVEGMEYDEKQKYGIVWNIFNSGGDGSIKMAGDAGVPDELYGLAVSSLSRQLGRITDVDSITADV